jgi:hypothetical protein
MVVTRCLSIINFQVLGDFVLIDLEKEIGLSLNLLVNIRGKTFLLFALELLLESQSIQLLLDERGDSIFDLLQMLMIALIN